MHAPSVLFLVVLVSEGVSLGYADEARTAVQSATNSAAGLIVLTLSK